MMWKNVVQNIRDMEAYLRENCSDLDTTAVKIYFGKGQQETGTCTHRRRKRGGGGRGAGPAII